MFESYYVVIGVLFMCYSFYELFKCETISMAHVLIIFLFFGLFWPVGMTVFLVKVLDNFKINLK